MGEAGRNRRTLFFGFAKEDGEVLDCGHGDVSAVVAGQKGLASRIWISMVLRRLTNIPDAIAYPTGLLQQTTHLALQVEEEECRRHDVSMAIVCFATIENRVWGNNKDTCCAYCSIVNIRSISRIQNKVVRGDSRAEKESRNSRDARSGVASQRGLAWHLKISSRPAFLIFLPTLSSDSARQYKVLVIFGSWLAFC